MVDEKIPTAQEARLLERLNRYQTSLELFRIVVRDSMSEDTQPDPKYLDELKSYVISLYVDLKPLIDKAPDFEGKFTKLEAALEEPEPKLNDVEARKYFLLIRNFLGHSGLL